MGEIESEDQSKSKVSLIANPLIRGFVRYFDANTIYRTCEYYEISPVGVIYELWRLNSIEKLHKYISHFAQGYLFEFILPELPDIIGGLKIYGVRTDILQDFTYFSCEVAYKDLDVVPLHYPLPTYLKDEVAARAKMIMKAGLSTNFANRRN